MRSTASPKRCFALAAALVASSVVGGGCIFGGREAPDIKSSDPALKIPAIKSAVGRNDTTVIAGLVRDLDSDDPAVRFFAIEGLHRLTGQTFGYEYFADADARKPARQQWQDWLNRTEAAAPVEAAAPAGEGEPMRATTDPPSPAPATQP